jgi:glycosyltransferase involved in cell wall biosynthesis
MKLLFISHDAYKAGAQLLLLQLLEWLKRHHKDIQIDTVLIEGGVLKQKFEALSHNVYVFSDYKKSGISLKDKILNKIKYRQTIPYLISILKHEHYDLIYANSVVSLSLGVRLKKNLDCKLLLHVHELETVIRERVPNFKNFLNFVDSYIAASNLVKHNLEVNHKVDSKLIDVVYAFSKVDTQQLTPSKSKKTLTVGGSGTVSISKGFDIFIKTAILIKEKHPQYPIKFIWVGGNNHMINLAKLDIAKAGLEETVFFIGEQDEPHHTFNDFDVFLMTSREDSFPLVCIEAAQLEKPIICFKDATGIEEVLVNGGGYIVPYLNVNALADKVIDYYENRTLLEQDGKMAKALFLNFTPEHQCPIIFEKIKYLSINA